ncbi:MAG: cobalamin-dependent protein [Deltaproteobacteria bacterium]|nr:cobalamin-dependent protein [Deltaproteobacteria bacterium]
MMHHFVFPINALPSCQMMDVGIDDILWNADIKFKALRNYYKRIDADILFYFHDAVIQAEAMGAKAKYSKKMMPAVAATTQVVSLPDPAQVPRMAVNANVLRRMAGEFPDKLRSALVYGPFTVAGQVAGEEALLRKLIDNPREVLSLLEKTCDFARRYASYLIEAGANLVWVSDPLSVLIPPDQFWEYSGVYLKRIFESFPSLPSVLHICGDTYQIVQEMVRTGVRGISFDNCMDLLVVEDEIPDDVYVIGNIDPVEVIELGSPDEVVSRTSDLVSVMALKDNFVLSTGCAVPPSAPIENVRLFLETGRKSFADIRPHIPMLSEISQNVYAGNGEETRHGVAAALEDSVDPLTIICSGLTRGIRKGSSMYEAKRCFLPSILLMVDAFYKGFKGMEDLLEIEESKRSSIIIGTVKGDIHEIGKNLVRIFLETHGHKVVDLGVDVSADAFIEAYQQYFPSIIGLSAFTTESRKEMEKVISAFRREGIRDVLFIVGGAAVNHEVSRSVGANGFARDAVRAVLLVEKLLKQSKDYI